jgi:hypothetical protein
MGFAALRPQLRRQLVLGAGRIRGREEWVRQTDDRVIISDGD